MEPKTRGKRIVSKGRFAILMGQKATLSVLGCLLVATVWVVGIIGFMLSSFILIMWAVYWAKDPGTETPLILVALGVCFGLILPLRLLLQTGYKIIHTANTMEQVVPLTRANAAYMSAPGTLVRASAEPVQEPQSILLRAVTDGQEIHEEQLMRASMPQENSR